MAPSTSAMLARVRAAVPAEEHSAPTEKNNNKKNKKSFSSTKNVGKVQKEEEGRCVTILPLSKER
jgi:hypothetical protein